MWDGLNKRKFPRIAVDCEIFIQSEPESLPITARTENLGVGGVCVILGEPLERFSSCRVKLQVDEKMPAIECVGKIVWIVPIQDSKAKKQKFDVGIEFLNLEMGAFESIRHFVLSEVQKDASKIVR